MKIRGSDLKRFYVEGWPSDDWYEEEGEDFQGISDSAIIDSRDLGCIAWQGDGPAPESGPVLSGMSVDVLYRRWQRSLSVVTIVAEVPRESADTVIAAIKAARGKVIA